MLLASMLGAAMLLMRLFPETPTAQRLHLYLVEVPIALAAKAERRHLILIVVLLFAGQMLATMGAADLALSYAFDLSLYFDVAITAAGAAAMLRMKGAVGAARQAIARPMRLLRAARARRIAVTRRTPPANDDEPAPAFLRAA